MSKDEREELIRKLWSELLDEITLTEMIDTMESEDNNDDVTI